VRLDKEPPLRASQAFIMKSIALSDIPEIKIHIFGNFEVWKT